MNDVTVVNTEDLKRVLSERAELLEMAKNSDKAHKSKDFIIGVSTCFSLLFFIVILFGDKSC